MCSGWVGGILLGCLAPEAASRVRTYSLRKPCRTSSFRYHPKASAEGGLVPLTVVIRIIIFLSEKYRVVLDGLQDLSIVGP